MEIIVDKNEDMGHYDTGGGTRDLTCHITIDANLPMRIQRHVVIYETLGALLESAFSHWQLENLADAITDALDQLE